MKRLFILLCILPLLIGCGASSPSLDQSSEPIEDSSVEKTSAQTTWIGSMKEVMTTSFFEFTVADAELLSELQGYILSQDMKVLAVEVTIHNVMPESIPMMDTDFQLQWEDTSDNAYAYPITSCTESVFENQPVSHMKFDNQLACRYELDVDETVTGILYYEVPVTSKSYSLSYREYFSNQEYGDTFAVMFSVE